MGDVDIKAIEPKGLESYPTKPPDVRADSISMAQDNISIDDHVSWLAIILLYLKESIISSTLTQKQGVPMESKVFWKSKTLWVNVISIIGVFVCPLFGVTLSPEIIAVALTVVNTILRLVTKQEVTFWE